MDRHLEHDKLSLIEFIADTIRAQGGISTYWLCTDEAVRKKAIRDALSAYEVWRGKEEGAARARESWSAADRFIVCGETSYKESDWPCDVCGAGAGEACQVDCEYQRVKKEVENR